MKNYFNLISERNLADWISLSTTVTISLSLYFAIQDQAEWAICFCLVGCVIDTVDGFIARKFNQASQFGRELDSTIDLLNYIVVPVIFMFCFFQTNQILLIITSILLVAGGSLRLIRFNVNGYIETDTKRYYQGLIVPFIPILVFGVYFLSIFNYQLLIPGLVVMIVSSLLMVSDFKFVKINNYFWWYLLLSAFIYLGFIIQ